MDMGTSRRSEQLSILFEDSEPSLDLPATRAECQGPGVCLKLTCKWNTTLEITSGGSIKLNAPSKSRGPRTTLNMRNGSFVHCDSNYTVSEFDELVLEHLATCESNCALDAADRGGMSIDEVAAMLGATCTQAQQDEAGALRKLGRKLARFGIALEDALDE